MLRFYSCAAVLALLLPAPAVWAQTRRPLRIVTYYDSARTQRRTVYGAQLTGARPDTVAHGPFRRFWPGGGLAELGHFSAGQPDSVWTRYYLAKPGQPAAVARRLPMHAGQPHGPFVVFHPDGRVAQRGTFRRGQLVDSLVSTGKTGRPRLLARFDSSRAPGLRGSFRHWGWYTANQSGPGFDWFEHQGEGRSGNNPMLRRDPTRYWTGQLAAGRLVGAYTEHDADGEPRLRLVYTAQGQWRLSTLYYPAAWLRYEQGLDSALPADSVVHSLPLYEWQPVGRRPYLLQRYWSFTYGSAASQSADKVFKLTPLEIKWNQHTRTHQVKPRHLFVSELTGAWRGPGPAAPLPPQVAAAFLKSGASQPAPACNNLETQYRTHGRPPLSAVRRRYPPLSRYRQPLALEAVRHPGRWRLGPADTTGASLRPARQRTTAFANGSRLVETRHTTRTYFANGQLQYFVRRGILLGAIDREYYPNGNRKEQHSAGWLGTSSRAWDEAGHPTRRSYESPLGEYPGKGLRRQLRQWHPLRKARQQLRRLHPLRPVGRAFRKIFPRRDHHAPRPRKH